MNAPALECRRITKRFDGVTALSQVDFELKPGEVHALCGENGAGKSTLIKVLGGIHPYGSYSGELLIGGAPALVRSAADARAAGIAVVYQELALVQEMTVAENIFLGKEPMRAGFIDWAAVFTRAQRVLRQFAIDIDPAARVGDLGIGCRQLVEIAKALAAEPRIIILDEPTAALGQREVQALLQIIRTLRARGVSCLYISHRLEEVFTVADRITVLRDGRSIITQPVGQTTAAAVIRHMVGRELTTMFPRHTARPGKPLLTVRDLSVAAPDDERLVLCGITFEVHEGEVLGIGGLMGAGRTELLLHLLGAWGRRKGGSVQFQERLLGGRVKPHHIIGNGLALVTEDRSRFGLVLDQTVGFNLSLSCVDRFTSHGLIDRSREFNGVDSMFRRLAIKARDPETPVRALSGGNQQKVVLGKSLMTTPRVVLLDEPTRGIDIGAKAEIYELINSLTAAGCGIVLVSSEIPELLAMSDRIVMLHAGKLSAPYDPGRATQEVLLAAAMGQEGRFEAHAVPSSSTRGEVCT